MVYGMKPGDKYYDGPIVDDGRTLEELERDIEAEKEKMKHIKCSWERIMVYGMKPGDKYYDGPIVDDGRTLEELERDIEAEKEKMKHIKWDPSMLEE